MRPPELYTEHEAILHWKRLTTVGAVPSGVRVAGVEAVDTHLDGMLLKLTAQVLGQRLPPHTETATGTAVFESPDSWWQHLKHQHGHRWWLRPVARRRPVRMAATRRVLTLTATWEHMAAYPWAEAVLPVPASLGAPVHLRWLTSTTSWEQT